jgi:hypothetical protein
VAAGTGPSLWEIQDVAHVDDASIGAFIHNASEASGMDTIAGKILIILFALAFYLGLPTAIVAGWLHWRRRRQQRTAFSTLSLIGFALATASALLAVSSMVYAQSAHFAYYDPLLLRIFGWGGLLSLSGIVFGICGAWRPSSLRWYAPACALGMLLFWFAMAISE